MCGRRAKPHAHLHVGARYSGGLRSRPPSLYSGGALPPSHPPISFADWDRTPLERGPAGDGGPAPSPCTPSGASLRAQGGYLGLRPSSPLLHPPACGSKLPGGNLWFPHPPITSAFGCRSACWPNTWGSPRSLLRW